jgi:hypothetical protein
MSEDDTLKLAVSRKEAALALRAVEEAVRGERSLRATADAFAEDWPAFGHVSKLAPALPYYEAVARTLGPLLDRGDSARARCFQNLATVLATIGRVEEAERIRRDVFDDLRAARPPGDDERIRACQWLASVLRRSGEHSAADALYAEVPICTHLRPLREALLRRGAFITNAGHLWSDAGISLWFSAVLDPDELRRELALDACVIRTENDDPRSGPELGLYCKTHRDSVVGPHPRFAG